MPENENPGPKDAALTSILPAQLPPIWYDCLPNSERQVTR